MPVDSDVSSARAQVADFWDEVLARWEPGKPPSEPELHKWFGSYQGTGKRAVDLAHYPDPYIGDLRGVRGQPRLVALGLNPGVGYDELQGPQGIWTERIREKGYSRCFERSPAEDEDNWRRLHHGRASLYWNRMVRFARRWLQDDSAGVPDILNLELYPWHSTGIHGSAMRPPPEVIEDFVWRPLREVPVGEVFAFGAPWFTVCEALKMTPTARFGAAGTPLLWPASTGWRIWVCELGEGRRLVVSSQRGNSGPPGEARVKILRDALASEAGSSR